MRKLALCLSILVCAGFLIMRAKAGPSSFTDETDQRPLPTLLLGCQSALSSIRSGVGTVLVKQEMFNSDGGTVRIESEYKLKFLHDKFKFSVSDKYLENSGSKRPADAIPVAPGEVLSRQVAYDGEKVVRYYPDTSSAEVDEGKMSCSSELAAYASYVAMYGLGVLDPATFVDPLNGFKNDPPRVVGRQTLNGDGCIVVQVQSRQVKGGAQIETYLFWIDPAKGYTVPRVEIWSEGAAARPEKALFGEVNVDLRSYGNGVWGPARSVITSYRLNFETKDLELSSVITTTYSRDFKVNVPVSRKDLELGLPAGITVTDNLLDREYTTK